MSSLRAPMKGVTLLEIMFALVILAIAMIPIAGVMGVGLRGTSKDFRSLVAVQVLESTMRQALAADYVALPTGTLDAPLQLVSSDNTATYTLILGEIATAGIKLNLTLDVTEKPIKMKYMPIRVDLKTFIASDPNNWIFDPTVERRFDGQNTVQPFRFKEIKGAVSWSESEMGSASKAIYMTTYLAKLEG